MRRLHRALALAMILLACGWALRDMRHLHAKAGPAPLPPLTRRDRVLVLAPHCDDETLGCGGLLQRAVKVGAAVQVVLITNGDGFRAAAEQLTGDAKPTAQDFLKLAARRQSETLAALKLLGVRPAQVAFLGYPDGGTALMWMRNWTPRDLYRSTHTQDEYSPYANSFHRGAPYCGRSVLDDVETLIRRFRPTIVALPHAADTHPDHWAAYCYGTAALYELRLYGRVRRLHYAVHERGWPADPRADTAAYGTWRSLSLTHREQQRKRSAIQCYRSQLAVMKRYLLSFAEPTETFAELGPVRLARRPPGSLRVDGASGDWRGVGPPIVDAAESGLPAGADITSLRACEDGRSLYLLIELQATALPDLSCDIHLHHITRGRLEDAHTYRVDLTHPVSRITWRARGRLIEIALPVPARDWEGTFLSVDTIRNHKLVDRTRTVLLLRK